MDPHADGPRCGICGSATPVFLFRARDTNFRTTDEVFSVFRCAACGVAQTHPVPAEEDLGRHYPVSYYPTGASGERFYRVRVRPAQRDKLGILRRFRTSGSLLDVGCGAGFFVRDAGQAGFRAQGIEFSREAVEFGRRAFDVSLTQGDLLGTEFPRRTFDVVTLWQVLEHIPRALDTIRRIRALLLPGGILIIAVPNFDSIQARLFRHRWYHLEVPRHIYHFTPAALRSLLAREGFDILDEIHRSREHNWAGILGSVMPIVAPNGSFHGRLLRALLGRPLARGAAAVEAALRRGGTFTLVAASRP